ncbi:alpha/beta hydrolase [Streptomyces sp. NPDC002276]
MRSDVVFPSAGLKLAGHLYRPDGIPRAAIVVGHPGTGVKEQASGLYARLLAERGFVTLAFDAAYQGESEGEPRGLEDPGQRVEDLKAAVSYLGALDGVDPERVGVLGICASGGYALAATATDPRVRAVATVSAVDISRQFRLGADGGQDPAVVQGLLAAAAEARGADVERFPLFPATEEEARAGGPHAYEGWEYYCTPRAQHPRSAKSLTWSSVDRIAGFDAFSSLGLIAPRPVLFIAGRAAVTSWMSVEAYQKAYGVKELAWIEGASHVDLYDRDEYVTPAVEKLSGFFGAHLGV